MTMETWQYYADSARGIYIPQFFAESVKRECVSGVSEEDWNILESGPELVPESFDWDTFDN